MTFDHVQPQCVPDICAEPGSVGQGRSAHRLEQLRLTVVGGRLRRPIDPVPDRGQAFALTVTVEDQPRRDDPQAPRRRIVRGLREALILNVKKTPHRIS